MRRLTADDNVKSVLSGTPLGHRAHPMLTDIPIGCWTSASLVDFLSFRSGNRASKYLTGIGVLASVPAIATGLSDWDDTHGDARRVGVVHMTANSAAVLLEFSSWRARRRGHHVRGALLGLAGLGAVTVGGYLGGHLVFAGRVGVDAEIPIVDDSIWHAACRVDELVESEPIGVTLDGVRVALVRRHDQVYALAAVCSHAGGPLEQGKVRGNALVCPWHGSTFCLQDGAVERGPATTPQPVYESRVRGEMVELRLVAGDTTPAHAVV